MKVAERFWVIFDKTITVCMFGAAVLVLFDALAVTVDVLLRKFLGITYTGLFEITEYSLLWMTFLGTAWIMRNNQHVRVDLVLNRLEPKSKAIVNGIASIICVILLCVLTWYSIKLALHDYQADIFLATVLEPPKWPIEITIPVGFFLLLIQSLRNTYGHLMSWRASSGGEL